MAMDADAKWIEGRQKKAGKAKAQEMGNQGGKCSQSEKRQWGLWQMKCSDNPKASFTSCEQWKAAGKPSKCV
jgi:hypothetical protein